MVTQTFLSSTPSLTLRRESLPPVVHINCPQQTNSYDCGVYVLLFADKVASFLFSADSTTSLTSRHISESVENVVPEDCIQFRQHIVEVIRLLIEEEK